MREGDLVYIPTGMGSRPVLIRYNPDGSLGYLDLGLGSLGGGGGGGSVELSPLAQQVAELSATWSYNYHAEWSEFSSYSVWQGDSVSYGWRGSYLSVDYTGFFSPLSSHEELRVSESRYEGTGASTPEQSWSYTFGQTHTYQSQGGWNVSPDGTWQNSYAMVVQSDTVDASSHYTSQSLGITFNDSYHRSTEQGQYASLSTGPGGMVLSQGNWEQTDTFVFNQELVGQVSLTAQSQEHTLLSHNDWTAPWGSGSVDSVDYSAAQLTTLTTPEASITHHVMQSFHESVAVQHDGFYLI